MIPALRDTLFRKGAGCGLVYWFWIFILYSALGCLLESGFARVTHAPDQTRRCFFVLPLCPVYGLGMATVLALPQEWRQGLWLPIAGGIITTAVEYGYHWLGEAVFSVRFWDYSGQPGCLRGRVCLPFSIAWGVLTAAAVVVIQPLLTGLIARIPPSVTYLVLLAFTADLVYSVQALLTTHSLDTLRTRRQATGAGS